MVKVKLAQSRLLVTLSAQAAVKAQTCCYASSTPALLFFEMYAKPNQSEQTQRPRAQRHAQQICAGARSETGRDKMKEADSASDAYHVTVYASIRTRGTPCGARPPLRAAAPRCPFFPTTESFATARRLLTYEVSEMRLVFLSLP